MKEHPEPQETLPIYSLIEQTVVQIAYHAGGAEVLDPKQYVLDNKDAWDLGDSFASPDRVLRHYLVYLRPKFWTEAAAYYRR